MHVDRTTIENSSLGEHHMVWNAKTKLYTDELKYRVQAIWNIYLLDAALPKEFSTVAVQEKKNYWGKRLLWAFKLLRNHILVSVNFYFILFSFVTGEIYFGALMIFIKTVLVSFKMRFKRPKVSGHFKPEYRLMSSVDIKRNFLLFIELQISDIASNIDAYERKLQRASYFQRKTASQVYTFRDRALPINPVKKTKTGPEI